MRGLLQVRGQAIALVTPQKHYVALDGLRGFAALAVVQCHMTAYFGGGLASSYLAVDAFFCLSGFVVAAAYGARLRTGELSFWAFLGLRALRFWPLYLLALAVSLVAVAARTVMLGADTPNLGLTALLSALMIPVPSDVSGLEALYPLLFPSWSLLWELVASAAFGLLALRLRTRHLIALAGFSACVLFALSASFGSLDLGAQWSGFWGGGARVAFSFTAGVVTFRLRPSFKLRHASWLIVTVMLAALLAPVSAADRPLYDSAVAVFLLPGLIWLASAASPSPASARIFTAIGGASYGLYLLHVVTFQAVGFLFTPGPVVGAFALAALVYACWWLDGHYDLPVRQAMRRLMASRTTPRTASGS